MNIKCFIGIDPGKQGSFSVIEENNLQVISTPLIGKNEYDIPRMHNLLKHWASEDSFIVIERAQPMPKQGTVSMFSFGMGYGIWLAIISVLEKPYSIIHSKVWTKVMLAGAPGEGKDRALHVARKLFPQWQPELKKEYQYADSILLAEYARRLYFPQIK